MANAQTQPDTTEKAPRGRKSRRNQVMDTALKLFSHYGMDGVSHAMIAEASGLAKSSVGKLFGTKEQLAELCASRFIDEFVEKVEAQSHVLPNYRAMAHSSAQLFKEYRGEWSFIATLLLTPAHHEIATRLWSEELAAKAMVLEPYAEEITPELLPDMLYCMLALHFSYIIGGNEARYDLARKTLLDRFLGPEK